MNLVFTRSALHRIDAEAIEQHGIAGLQLMENAARGATRLACTMLKSPESPARVLVACGRGNNGGDGWAIARLLADKGHLPHVVHLGNPATGSDAWVNMERAHRAGIPSDTYQPECVLPCTGEMDLVIDAIFGTGLDRAITGDPLSLVRSINAASVPVLAVDLPSGLDADSGQPLGEAVRASTTATFVGPKVGFATEGASAWTGEVHVIDIGVPDVLLQEHGTPAGH